MSDISTLEATEAHEAPQAIDAIVEAPVAFVD